MTIQDADIRAQLKTRSAQTAAVRNDRGVDTIHAPHQVRWIRSRPAFAIAAYMHLSYPFERCHQG